LVCDFFSAVCYVINALLIVVNRGP